MVKRRMLTMVTAKSSLRNADPSAVDAAGNTPGHLAAMHGHVVVLSELIKRAEHPIDLDLQNHAGLSIRAILQQRQEQPHSPAAGKAGSARSSRETPTRSGSSSSSSQGGRQWSTGGGGSRQMGAEAAAAEEEEAAAAAAEWRAKLADEVSDDEGGWGSLYRASWKPDAETEAGGHMQGHSARASAAADDDEGDEDAWADRLWQDMQDHKRHVAQQAAAARVASATSAAQRQGFVGDRGAAAQERQRQAAAAAEGSERILREERAKDSNWRASMMRQIEEAAMPTRRATYEQQWAALDNLPENKPITYRDIPWPALAAPATLHQSRGPQQQPELKVDVKKLRTMVFGGATGPAALKAALRKELMRWHPDKFGARFGSRLAAQDRDSILAGVQAVAQQLTRLKTI